jgi:hypothetical protein
MEKATGVSLVPPEKRPRTKDDDEDEKDWDRTLNRYDALLTAIWARRLATPDKAETLYLPQSGHAASQLRVKR